MHWLIYKQFSYLQSDLKSLICWAAPSYSKLTMLIVNVLLTLIIQYGIYANIFAEKM